MVPRYLNSNQVAQADEQVSYLRKKCHSKMGDGGVTGKAMLWKLETLLLLPKVAAGSCCSSSPAPGGERKRYWDLVRKHEKGQPCQFNLEDKSKI